MEKLTLKQLLQISHTLGINLFRAVMSHKLKDKKLPKEFYRNRFQAKHDDVFEELVSLGFAKKSKWQDLDFYYVTEKGVEVYMEEYNKIVEYKKPDDRDLPYLKKRINFYCSYYNYRFCDDNSEHVISTYLNYWIKSYRVSHTTEDTIQNFKTDLKQYHRKKLI